MNLYIPATILSSPSGYLVGWKSRNCKKAVQDVLIICVVQNTGAVLPSLQTIADFVCETGVTISSEDELTLSYVGLWLNRCESKTTGTAIREYLEVHPSTDQEESFVVLLVRDDGNLEVFKHFDPASDDGSDIAEDIVMVLFAEPQENTFYSLAPLTLAQNSLPAEVKKFSELDRLEVVLTIINYSQQLQERLGIVKKKKWFESTTLFRLIYFFAFFPWKVLFSSSLWCLTAAANLHDKILNSWMVKASALQSLIQQPASLNQLKVRFEQIKNIYSYMCGKVREDPHCPRHKQQSMWIIAGDRILAIGLDFCLGVAAVYWLYTLNHVPKIANIIDTQTNSMATALNELLQWLMGVPAGLKLNEPLDHFLGSFFSYHIHLWQTYLVIIKPYLLEIIWMLVLSGCFGLSFLMSVMADVVSVLTFHVYCFYVYAARLYSLQISGLVSLARLFRGKKWNVLRHRVDSLDSDVDQLFIGTVLFTVLLFLLPTVMLYYVVFTLLRLVVLIFQALLHVLVVLFNTLPLFGLGLFFLYPKAVPGGVTFIIDNPQKHKTPTGVWLPSCQQMCVHECLRLDVKTISFSALFHLRDNYTDIPNFMDLVSKLVRGQLIYPWVESQGN